MGKSILSKEKWLIKDKDDEDNTKVFISNS
jgi:hypothetical protein